MRPPAMMLPRHGFVKAVAEGLRACRVPRDAGLLVAVSGGADSVALLRVLAALRGRRTWALRLAVGHVQHHLRPEDHAEGDAALVASLAADLGLPYYRADLPTAPLTGNAEGWARAERYAALARMAAAADAAYIATAHHADDQLETLLMRMLRGASVAGWRGLARRRRLASSPPGDGTRPEGGPPPPPLVVVRPMLGVRRAAARAFLAELGQPWREDATNADATRCRARLRAEVLPRLLAIRPDAAERAVGLGEHFRGLTRLLRVRADAAEARADARPDAWSLPRETAKGLPRVVLGELLRRWVLAAGGRADAAGTRHLAPLLRAVRDRRGGERRFTLSRGVVITVTRDAVVVAAPPVCAGGEAR